MAQSTLNGARVLLLEDEALIHDCFVDLIKSFECKVTGCMHLRDAWKSVRKELPDVAVMDVNIHAETSYELAEWLHKRCVPIIFLTGYPAVTLLERWREHPVCEKPCHPDELQTLLTKALLTGKDQTAR